jgi:hypothetical protein
LFFLKELLLLRGYYSKVSLNDQFRMLQELL